MAIQDRSGNTAAPRFIASNPGTDGELKISIRPLGLEFWEFEGTRSQLEAEGVIPTGINWPDGCAIYRWECGRLRYSLGRTRPAGLKGPMTLWVKGDWWFLRCEFNDGLSHASRRIIQKKRELAAEIYFHSEVGQREWSARRELYWKTREDRSFQHFKSKVPGLEPAQRRRRTTSSADEKSLNRQPGSPS